MGERLRSRKLHFFGDNISTDLIIPGKYKFRTTKAEELAKHAMEGADPKFSAMAGEGDFIIAEENFGCGSSREQAPLALKGLGIKAIIAKSFARIFFRNAINLGLIVIESREIVENTRKGDILEIDFKEGYVENVRGKKRFIIKPLPRFLSDIIEAGGVTPYYKKHGRLPWQNQ